MIREFAPGHVVDLTDRVAVIGRVATGDRALVPPLVQRHIAGGADAVVVHAPGGTDHDAVASLIREAQLSAGDLPVLDWPVADAADLTGVLPSDDPDGAHLAAQVTLAVDGGARVIVVDDVRAARRVADLVAAIQAARP
ncbi:MAG: hypothetical protein ACKOYM_01185 [Actinomycetes bacterium]